MGARSREASTGFDERAGTGLQWSSIAVRAIVLAFLAIAPWAFGSVEPWARLVLYLGFAAALGIWLAQLARRPRLNLPLPLAALPMMLALVVGFVQTIPLRESALALVAPGTSRWREQVLPTSPEVLAGADRPFSTHLAEPTVSLYPSATRSALFELALYLSAFLLGFQYFRRRGPQLWLCGVATAVGGAVALLGLVQWLSGTQQIYWVVELSQGGGPFGPFVNRNNAGGFLNLCLAASLGLLLYVTRPARRDHTPRRHGSSRSRPLAERLVTPLADRLADLTSVRLGLFATTGLIVAAVLCTLSRGAFLAMTGGAAVTLLAAMAARRSRSASLLAVIGVVAVLLVAWIGMTQTVQSRLATIWPEPEEKPHALIPHWQDSLSAVPDFWRLGSGLGTYRFVYRAYERQPSHVVFYHAENLYVETLLETGAVGLGLLLAAIGLLAAAAWEVTRTGHREQGSPLAFAGIFAVASQAIHSMADFGLYIPSNALWFAVLCGSLVGRAMLTRRSARAGAPGPKKGTVPLSDRGTVPFFGPGSARMGFAPVLLPMGAAGLLLLVVLGALDAKDSVATAEALRAWRLGRKEAGAPGPQIERTIAEFNEALSAAWSDAEVHQALAELYMTRYRLEAAEALRPPTETQPNAPPEDVPEPGAVADPLRLSARLRHVPDSARDEARRALQADPIVRRSLLPALEHALLAREFCLLLPRVELHLAELSFLMRSGDSDAVYLDRARLLAPSDDGLWFGAGLLDWDAGRAEAACRSWRGSLALSDRYLNPILEGSASRLPRAKILAEVLPDKPAILLAATGRLYPSDDALVERRPFLEKALDLLANQAAPLTAADLGVKAGLHRQLGQAEQALEAYQAALAREPRQADWRYELADLLYEHTAVRLSVRGFDPSVGVVERYGYGWLFSISTRL